jgi:hypothetical protein
MVDDTQKQMSEVLLEELEKCGYVGELDEFMILDALACAGLALYKPQFENPASREFIEALGEVALDTV